MTIRLLYHDLDSPAGRTHHRLPKFPLDFGTVLREPLVPTKPAGIRCPPRSRRLKIRRLTQACHEMTFTFNSGLDQSVTAKLRGVAHNLLCLKRFLMRLPCA